MLYTVKETSRILKCNVNLVYTLINTGLLKSLKLGSRKIRDRTLEKFLDKYDGQDIDEIIEQKRLENQNNMFISGEEIKE